MCELKGIVTGTPSKIDIWKKTYNLEDHQIYNYDNFDNIADNDEIDIVYCVVLPNHMHKAFTTRAFRVGKHVICEKPMVMNAQEATQMIEEGKDLFRNYSLGIACIMNYIIESFDCAR